MAIRFPDRPVRPGVLRRLVGQAPDPKGFRVEIIRGRIVLSPTPSFKHSGIVQRVAGRIRGGLEQGRGALQRHSIASPHDPDDYCTPDLVVVPAAIEDEDGWLLDADTVDLAVEVLSPGNAPSDVLAKLEEYAAWHIPVYLFIDPRDGTAVVYSEPSDGKYRTVH
ncbi:putative restriction endonuclease [Murinocardiopsis flavida]|uniref:Putative restriction endonuclease n=1 Tax=Murinocardiopsis flavida TaxID=645275 RepID=A0A2P8DUC2_9ACTN|nr:Uma2 family endonuclease [Murinocardiopsis flavida]PSL00819.1 putative restriction endonuclease [Murinocardiopsis flavida]